MFVITYSQQQNKVRFQEVEWRMEFPATHKKHSVLNWVLLLRDQTLNLASPI